MSSSAVVDLLGRCAEQLETHGWCQTEGCTWDGQMCLVAALMYTAAALRTPLHDILRASALLRAATGAEFLIGWNDVPGRTLDEVMAALRAAMTEAETRG